MIKGVVKGKKKAALPQDNEQWSKSLIGALGSAINLINAMLLLFYS